MGEAGEEVAEERLLRGFGDLVALQEHSEVLGHEGEDENETLVLGEGVEEGDDIGALGCGEEACFSDRVVRGVHH